MKSVREIYAYYKTYGIKTVVMGASFRSAGEIEALAGCDRLTISPEWLDHLAKDEGPLPRRLDPARPGPAPARMTMDEKKFRWMLNENQMATEKLSDGIRLFAHDLGDPAVDDPAEAQGSGVTRALSRVRRQSRCRHRERKRSDPGDRRTTAVALDRRFASSR